MPLSALPRGFPHWPPIRCSPPSWRRRGRRAFAAGATALPLCCTSSSSNKYRSMRPRRCSGGCRQKREHARRLAATVAAGDFDFDRLAAAEDEAALATLRKIKGIGRWSAEIYLLFALGRTDIWPAADLGLQIAVTARLRCANRLDERALRQRGEAWRPWRSVAACLFWQSYLHARDRDAPELPAELYL